MGRDPMAGRWGRLVRRIALSRWVAALLMLALITALLFTTAPSPLSAALLAAAAILMSAATAQRARVAWSRTLKAKRPSEHGAHAMEAAPALLAARLARRGWVRLAADPAHPDDVRLVRNPWGHWAGVALHAGIVVALLSSLVVTLTNARGVATLHLGETLAAGAPWDAAERGPLAGALTRPGDLALERLDVAYRSGGDLDRLASTVADRESGSSFTTAVNTTAAWRGTRVYQSQEFGPSYVLEFTGPDAPAGRTRIDLLNPDRPGRPAYRDITLDWLPYTLRAKGFADANGDRVGAGPLLVLRLEKGGIVAGQAELAKDGTGTLGPYEVRLVALGAWDRLIFVRDDGIPGVFAGFVVICLSAALIYLAPPREVYIATDAPGPRLWWRAGRFAAYYRSEEETIVRIASGEEDPRS